MILKLLAKKHVREILKLLNEHEYLNFGQILREININQSNLSKLLNELVDAGLLEKWEEKEGYKLPKAYYKITDEGKNALIIYEIEENLKNLKKKQVSMIHNIIYGKPAIVEQ